MRGFGQKYGGGTGLYPITELESENHTSMHQQNYNQFGLQQSNGGGYNQPVASSHYQPYTSNQNSQNNNFVREENLKYMDLEKIFSDTDDSVSRMNDSILDDCDNLVPKENQRQFQQNVLTQFQSYRSQTSKDFQKSYGQHFLPDKSLDLTLNLTNNYNSGKNNVFMGGAHENSINDSLMNIVNELGGDNRLRHQGTSGSNNNNNLNDTQVMYQNYEDTVKMMSQLQRQLGTSVDSNQASLLRSDKFRTSQEQNPGGVLAEAVKRSAHQAPIQQPLQHSMVQQPYQPQQIIQGGVNYISLNQQQFNNIQQPKQQVIVSNQITAPSPKVNDYLQPKHPQTSYQYPNTQSTSISSDYNKQNPVFSSSNGFDSGLVQSHAANNTAVAGLKYSLQSPQQNFTLNNSNGFSQYQTPPQNKQNVSQFGSGSTVFSSPQSLQSSHFSAFQSQGFNSKQRKIFSLEQKAILKQAEQRIQQSNDPFLYQKRMEQELLSERNYQKLLEEELPVFCINCEEYIKLVDVDKHAEKECDMFQKRKAMQKQNTSQFSSTQNTFRGPESGDSLLKEISDKILQIEQQVNSRLVKLKQCPPSQQNNQLIEASNVVLRQSQNMRINNESAIQIQHHTQQIQLQRQQIAVLQSENKNIGMLILWDRLIFLGDEKALKVRYFKERQPNVNYSFANNSQDREIMLLEQELKKLDGMTQKEREKVQYWKMQSEMMEQIKKQDINNLKYIKDNHSFQIIKNLQSERDSETQSSAGLSSLTGGDIIVTNQIQVSNLITQNAEDRKKIFFKEALNVKFSLPSNHPARHLDLQVLYDTAMKQNVPQQKWSEFIRNKMHTML